MATEAPDTPEHLAKFGPLRAYQSGAGWTPAWATIGS